MPSGVHRNRKAPLFISLIGRWRIRTCEWLSIDCRGETSTPLQVLISQCMLNRKWKSSPRQSMDSHSQVRILQRPIREIKSGRFSITVHSRRHRIDLLLENYKARQGQSGGPFLRLPETLSASFKAQVRIINALVMSNNGQHWWANRSSSESSTTDGRIKRRFHSFPPKAFKNSCQNRRAAI